MSARGVAESMGATAAKADTSATDEAMRRPHQALPPVVLVHGFMQSARSWEGVAHELRDRGHRVIAIDLPGHGVWRGQRRPEELSFDACVDAVARAVEEASRGEGDGAPKPVLWGYSMGGRVAGAFAVRHPQALSALVLESAGMGPRSPQEREERAAKNRALAATLQGGAGAAGHEAGAAGVEAGAVGSDADAPSTEAARARLAAFVDRWEELPLFDSQRSLPPDARERVRAQRLDNDPEALALSLLHAGQQRMPDLRPGLSALELPILFMAGASDVRYSETVFALEREHAAAGVYPQAAFAVIEGAGHDVHLERPAAALDAVTGFLHGSRLDG